MAKVLVGGPEGVRKDIHDDLVARLKQEHDVTYVKNDGQSMFWELAKTPLVPAENRYGWVVYDTGLFYPAAQLERKIELFETGASLYLAKAEAPVLVLAEMEIAAQLRYVVEKIGFAQIDQPYDIEAVVHKINEIVGIKIY